MAKFEVEWKPRWTEWRPTPHLRYVTISAVPVLFQEFTREDLSTGYAEWDWREVPHGILGDDSTQV